MCDFSFRVLPKLVSTIYMNAAWTDDLDAQIGRTFHCPLTDQVLAALREKNQIGAADVVFAEDRVDVTVKAAELSIENMLIKNEAQHLLGIRMSRTRAWT